MKECIKKYPDGSSYIQLPDISGSSGFTIRINTYEDLWHLNQLVDAYNNWWSTAPTVFIPNLIDAQADKRFNANESYGLKLVCKFLNRMKAEFKIYHPHNPEIVEALLNHVEIVDNSKFINDVLFELAPGPGFYDPSKLNDLILMSSDAGGFKPLIKLCDKIEWKGETFSASKARSWDKENGTKFVQQVGKADFEGKDILIVDDICVYGGTFKGLSKLLRERNVGKLYLAVSHMTVQNLGKDPVTNYFDKVFTTNSKYDNYYTYDGQGYDKQMGVTPENLQIIKLW